MEDSFLTNAYRILAAIGGTGLIAGLFCEAYNALKRRRHPMNAEEEKDAYRKALIDNYKEHYHHVEPKVSARLHTRRASQEDARGSEKERILHTMLQGPSPKNHDSSAWRTNGKDHVPMREMRSYRSWAPERSQR